MDNTIPFNQRKTRREMNRAVAHGWRKDGKYRSKLRSRQTAPTQRFILGRGYAHFRAVLNA